VEAIVMRADVVKGDDTEVTGSVVMTSSGVEIANDGTEKLGAGIAQGYLPSGMEMGTTM
jgi:hypothetical protein